MKHSVVSIKICTHVMYDESGTYRIEYKYAVSYHFRRKTFFVILWNFYSNTGPLDLRTNVFLTLLDVFCELLHFRSASLAYRSNVCQK